MPDFKVRQRSWMTKRIRNAYQDVHPRLTAFIVTKAAAGGTELWAAKMAGAMAKVGAKVYFIVLNNHDGHSTRF